MRKYSRKIVIIKLSFISAAVLVAITGFIASADNYRARASVSGPVESHTNAPGEANCTACHSGNPVNSGGGNLTISGLPKNYLPGQQVPVTVTLNHFNGALFGFQATAIRNSGLGAGVFTHSTQAPVQLQTVSAQVDGNLRQYIMHTFEGAMPTMFNTKSWTFTWTAPATRIGKVSFYAAGNGADGGGTTSGDFIYTASNATFAGTPIANFDSDGKSDVSVFRPSTGVWYSLNSTNGGFQAAAFGTSGDVITPGDYDGDGKNDFSVFRPSTGIWYILRSSDGGFSATQWGANGDIPAVGDYDADNKYDLAVFRPSNGVWYIYHIGTGVIRIVGFGLNGDKPVQADFDADAKTDIAVWRPSDGVWYLLRSSAGFTAYGFGTNGDKPAQGDFDGDGRADAAVFRPSNGVWYVAKSSGGFQITQFGIATDRPSPGDFDGDGLTDIAVYRDGVWYVLNSSTGLPSIFSFGLAGDVPVPAGYIPQ